MKVTVTAIVSQLPVGTIFSAIVADGSPVRVKLREQLPVTVGDQYSVSGTTEVYNDRFGRSHVQIVSDRADRLRTHGGLIVPWLRTLDGLGEVRAKRLFEAFGDDLSDVLMDAERLNDVANAIEPKKPKLGRMLAAKVLAALLQRQAADEMAFAELAFRRRLEEGGVTDAKAARMLWRLIGSRDAEAVLMRNPYLGAGLLPWRHVDHLGLHILAESIPDPSVHPSRLAGACVAAWAEILRQGDTAATEEVFLAKLEGMLGNGLAPAAAQEGIKQNQILVRDGLWRAPGAAWLEDDLSRRIAALAKQKESTARDLHEDVHAAEDRTEMVLTLEQKSAVAGILGCHFSALQGGAGTGKTTVMKVLVDAWEHTRGRVIMACMSGKAAEVLASAVSSRHVKRRVRTVARLLADLDQRDRIVEEGGDPPEELARLDGNTMLIIDEASMVDTPSMHQIACRLPPGARLLLVGDDGQLPPVGIGRVFHDYVEDGQHVFRLTQVLRQASGNPIALQAAEVREGNTPEMEAFVGLADGIFWLPCKTVEVVKTVERVRKALDPSSAGDLLVCACLRDTVTALNRAQVALRTRETASLRVNALTTIAVGDPVVCTKNHYRHGLVNGLVGRIEAIDEDIMVRWTGWPQVSPLDEEVWDDIDLAFALTCHKAQGSSASRVIVALDRSRVTTREWIYTAITRARHQVVLVGEIDIVEEAVTRPSRRLTGFDVNAGTAHR